MAGKVVRLPFPNLNFPERYPTGKSTHYKAWIKSEASSELKSSYSDADFGAIQPPRAIMSVFTPVQVCTTILSLRITSHSLFFFLCS